MSVWKELKKVVNSNFNKTLDVQMTDNTASIINRINNLTFVDASDDIYKSMPDKELSIQTASSDTVNYVYPKFKMYNSGSLKIKFNPAFTQTSSGANYSLSFVIKKNGSTIFSETRSGDRETTITFESGDILSFEFSMSVSTKEEIRVIVKSKLSGFSLCGTVRQSVFEVV